MDGTPHVPGVFQAPEGQPHVLFSAAGGRDLPPQPCPGLVGLSCEGRTICVKGLEPCKHERSADHSRACLTDGETEAREKK